MEVTQVEFGGYFLGAVLKGFPDNDEKIRELLLGVLVAVEYPNEHLDVELVLFFGIGALTAVI